MMVVRAAGRGFRLAAGFIRRSTSTAGANAMIADQPTGEPMSAAEILDQILEELEFAIALAEKAGHEGLVKRLRQAQAVARTERAGLPE
jgi:hypothetical protein